MATITKTEDGTTIRTEWGVQETWSDGHVECRRRDSRHDAETSVRLRGELSYVSAVVVTRTVTASPWVQVGQLMPDERSERIAKLQGIRVGGKGVDEALAEAERTDGATLTGAVALVRGHLKDHHGQWIDYERLRDLTEHLLGGRYGKYVHLAALKLVLTGEAEFRDADGVRQYRSVPR